MFLKGNANDWQVRIRLGAAIILACYAIGYNIYYCLGLFSVELMELYINILHFIWPLFWLLPFVILTHVSLGLWKLFKRNTLKMPLWEYSQITLGTSIPFFLLPHITYTYGLFLFFGVKGNYVTDFLGTYPHFAWQFTAMTLAVWIHAQIGMHGVFRMRRWYPKIKLLIIIIFTLMPLLSIFGYFKAGFEIQNLISYEKTEQIIIPLQSQINLFKIISYIIYITFPVLYISVLIARGIRLKIRNKNKNIILNYSSGQKVNVFPKTTILESSRIANIPHASICGGRGRCTTCRVKINNGMDNLSSIGDREFKALKRIEAEKDVRLACQAECHKDQIYLTLLLPPDIKSIRARKENKYSVGKEIELIVMFADLRGFTKLSEEKFPYDVVFILNRYFNYMGEVIEKNNGKIDKFLGDGILAYFGFNTDMQTASKQAIKAGKEMAIELIKINEQLQNALKEPLKIGIGINLGGVILGELGYKDKTSLTIIGDAVNTASRLESLNKKLGSQMIFSDNIAEISKIDFSNLKKYKADIRGKKEPMEIYVVNDIVKDLENIL